MGRLKRSDVMTHQLFEHSDAVAAVANVSEFTKGFVTDFVNRGPTRELVGAPDDYLCRIDDLRSQFPNFRQYIDEVLVPDAALSSKARLPMSLTAALFVGPPGIGKTYFSSSLAAAFRLPFERMNLETAQASFEIVGIARGWSTCGPGRLLRWMAQSEIANGLFAFEELDKDTADQRYPASAAMLQLLEQATASQFADRSVPELRLNLLPLNYVFTANSLRPISRPLLSRLLVVEIPPLSAEDGMGVAASLYSKLLAATGIGSAAPLLSEEVLAYLGGQSPRQQRMLLKLALGRALALDAPLITMQSIRRQADGPRMGFY